MIKNAMMQIASVALLAVPVSAHAQAQTTPPTTLVPPTCDCPIDDSRGDLRNLKAFAPLGLLGVMAAAGGVPGVFAAKTATPGVDPNVIVSNAPGSRPVGDPEVSITDRARNAAPETPRGGEALALNRGRVPEPVSPDSMRAGLRAPNTGTPLPSVFLLGVGLVTLGCVTVFRARV